MRSSSPSDATALVRERDNEIRQLKDKLSQVERQLGDRETELGAVRHEYDQLIIDYELVNKNQQRIEDEWQEELNKRITDHEDEMAEILKEKSSRITELEDQIRALKERQPEPVVKEERAPVEVVPSRESFAKEESIEVVQEPVQEPVQAEPARVVPVRAPPPRVAKMPPPKAGAVG